MIIRSLDEFLAYQKALAAAHAVSAILERPWFGRDFKLREQLSASSSRTPALMAEGFEQKSDRHFAHYMYLARGSAKESKVHLIVSWGRRYVTKAESDDLCAQDDEIARMSAGLIQHLEKRTDRIAGVAIQPPTDDWD